MNRRKFINTTTAAVASLAFSNSFFSCGKHKSLPNIVYILADDMGYGDVSLLNTRDNKIPTPNIDRIGKEGMYFTDAHSGSAVCTPTRYGILTGRYCWRTRLKRGVLFGYNEHLIEEGRLTVPGLLKEYGYNTAAFGKWHLGMDMPLKNSSQKPGPDNINWQGVIKNGPISNGFDYFYGISASLDMTPYIYIENDRFVGECTIEIPKSKQIRKGPAEKHFKFEEVLPELTRKTVQYIKQQKINTPFFAYMALTGPHTPIVPSKEFQDKNSLGSYCDFCEQVDWTVGQVLDALDEKGFSDNTLIIFTSDNGCAPYIGVKELEAKGHFPSYIYRGYKADIFEGGHRIPFLARWPQKIKAGSSSSEMICLTDLLATCAAITGNKLPDNAGEDSYNVLPALYGDKSENAIREATVHHSINGSFSIRQGKWKLELCPGSGGWGYPKHNEAVKMNLPENQLYDLSTDISEKINIYKEHPDIVNHLKNTLQKYILDGRSTPGKPQSFIKPDKWPHLNWMDN